MVVPDLKADTMLRPARTPLLQRRLILGAAVALAIAPRAHAAGAAKIAAEARAARDRLYAADPKARAMGAQAKAVVVFPEIVKAGAVVGGQTGEGAAFVNNKVVGFFRISAASYGLQLGVQRFSYALFLMTDDAINYMRNNSGWSLGTGPSLVVADSGFMKSANTSTLKKDIYAVPFGQKGLMAGTGLEGSKITQITPGP